MNINQLIQKSVSLAGLPALITMAHAASLEVGFQATIASEQNPNTQPGNGEGRFYHVSVNPNNAGVGAYAADLPDSGDEAPVLIRNFSGPVVAYKWLGGTNNSIEGVSVSGGEAGLITYATSDTSFDGFAQGQLKLWNETDPGADLATGAGQEASGFDASGGGYRSFGGAIGTVDISQLGSGAIHIFYGAFGTVPTVSVAMKDTDGGSPDISVTDAHLNGDAANRTEYYYAEVNFVNDAGYDVIEYTWLANGVDYSGNGRGLGTVLTGAASAPFKLAITDFSYDSVTSTFDATMTGAANTAYVLVEADDLNFSNPNASPVVLGEASASVGAVVGNTIVTDENGNATIEGVALSVPKVSSFIRVELPNG